MEEAKRIYIGNLDFGVTEDDLKRILQEKGLTCTQANLIIDKYSGRSKGFGFAEFATEEETEKAIEALNGQDVNGRKLNVSKARKMEQRSRDGFGGPRHGRDNFDRGDRGGFKKRDRY